jgi:hypothetical protein
MHTSSHMSQPAGTEPRADGQGAFAVDDENTASIIAGRSIVDIDPNEMADIIIRTARMADYYDDVLLDEFGRGNALGAEPPKEEPKQ